MRTVIELNAHSPHHKRALSKAYLELAKADEKCIEEQEKRIADCERNSGETDVPVKAAPAELTPQPAATEDTSALGYSNGGNEPVPAPAPVAPVAPIAAPVPQVAPIAASAPAAAPRPPFQPAAIAPAG